MLAGYLDVTLPVRPETGFGMRLDPENNAISDLAEGGVAARAGMQVGDLIVLIDEKVVTNFDAAHGPVEGTLLVQSAPVNIFPVQNALAAGQQVAHSIRLLRAIDPSTLPVVPEPESGDQLLREFEAQAQAQARYATRPGVQPYAWAGEIAVPDETFGARGGESIKSKYNLKAGAALPPLQKVVASHETDLRKTMLVGAGRPSLFMQHQR